MPWFEERSLFVGDTQIRWYEPGVRERRVDVHPQPDGRLPLEAGGHGVVHGHGLVGQHDALARSTGRREGARSTGEPVAALSLSKTSCSDGVLKRAHRGPVPNGRIPGPLVGREHAATVSAPKAIRRIARPRRSYQQVANTPPHMPYPCFILSPSSDDTYKVTLQASALQIPFMEPTA